ncbi:hypothetical protein KAU08_05925 [bacterium]|nr:hypothetical protein [bacterium]
MEIQPFHNYSNSLIPLPPLGPEVAPPESQEVRSFADEMRSRITNPEADSSDTDVHSPGIFDLASPDPSIATNIREFRGNLDLQSGSPEVRNDYEKELMQACREVEGFLLGILLKNIGGDFGGSELFKETGESSFYNEMFFYELAQSIGTNPPGIGIADRLYNDIIMNADSASDPKV